MVGVCCDAEFQDFQVRYQELSSITRLILSTFVYYIHPSKLLDPWDIETLLLAIGDAHRSPNVMPIGTLDFNKTVFSSAFKPLAGWALPSV